MKRVYSVSKKNQIEQSCASLTEMIESVSYRYDNWRANYASRINMSAYGYDVSNNGYGHDYSNILGEVTEINCTNGFYASSVSFMEKCHTSLEATFQEAYDANIALSNSMTLCQESIDLVTSKLEGITSTIVGNSKAFEESSDIFMGMIEAPIAAISIVHAEKIYKEIVNDDKWKALLSKPAETLTQEEYIALAMVYVGLDEEGLSTFLTLCLRELSKEEIEEYINLGIELRTQDAIDEKVKAYVPDVEKQSQIQTWLSVILNKSLEAQYVAFESKEYDDSIDPTTEYERFLFENEDYFESVYDDLAFENQQLFQKNLILDSLSSIRLTLLTPGKELTVHKDIYLEDKENNRTYYDYNIEYYTSWDLAEKHHLRADGVENLTNSQYDKPLFININHVVYAGQNSSFFIDGLEDKYEKAYCVNSFGNSLTQQAMGTVKGEVIGYAVGAAQDKVGKSACKALVGAIPIVGDIAVFAYDVHKGTVEDKKAYEERMADLDLIKSGAMLDFFSVNTVAMETSDPFGSGKVSAMITPETFKIVENYNTFMEKHYDEISVKLEKQLTQNNGVDLNADFNYQSISVEDILTNPNEMEFISDFLNDNYAPYAKSISKEENPYD